VFAVGDARRFDKPLDTLGRVRTIGLRGPDGSSSPPSTSAQYRF
jgi:hypothetical protein